MSSRRRKTEGTPVSGGSTTRMSATPEPSPEERRSTGAAVVRWIRGALLDNAALKFVALVLSLTVFILVHSDERAIAGATVRVNYILPEDRVLVSEPVKEVSVTVAGSRRRLKRFHDSELEDIELDLRNMSGGEIFFQPSMIEGLPDGVELVSITPDRVKVELDEREVREIPVSVETVGTPGRGYRVESIDVTPSQVKASGAGSRLAAIDAIPTAALRLEGRTASFRAEVRLALPPGIEVDGEPVVRVRVVLGEEQGSRQLELPVAIQPAQGVAPDQAARFQVEPERVRVVLRGSILAIDAVHEDQLSAYVRLFPDDVSRGGTRKAEVRINPALPGIGYEVSPPDVTLVPRP
ncbi:MAG TPA: CdaR family protein [Kofleriaceae bacterium]|nr:CdaR family protein [Kofleriaceae bacterium]